MELVSKEKYRVGVLLERYFIDGSLNNYAQYSSLFVEVYMYGADLLGLYYILGSISVKIFGTVCNH